MSSTSKTIENIKHTNNVFFLGFIAFLSLIMMSLTFDIMGLIIALIIALIYVALATITPIEAPIWLLLLSLCVVYLLTVLFIFIMTRRPFRSASETPKNP